MTDNVKDPRGFEPPPWEQAQFEEIARKRAAQEEAQRAAAEAAATREAERAAATLEAAAATQAAPAPEVPAEEGTAGPVAKPETAEVDMMLMGLQSQEPPALRGAWVVPMVVGVPVVVMGAVMAVLGVMSLAGSKGADPGQKAAVTGVLLVGALALFGLGGWLVMKSLKARSIGG